MNHPDTDPVLDAELISLLNAALEPEPLAPAAHARIKHRLLRRLAADSTERHLTLDAGGAGWRPFSKGVSIKMLNESGGVASYLLHLQAGASVAPHRHPVDEECVVLQGEVQIGALRIGAGGFHLGRQGVLHDRLSSTQGAVIFLRGATPTPDLVL
jgi:ChrR Cupin-like domain